MTIFSSSIPTFRSACATASEIDDSPERPVADGREHAHFGVVDAPRDDGRHVGKGRGQATEHVRPPAAVTVDEVGLRILDELREAIGERQVDIARTEQ